MPESLDNPKKADASIAERFKQHPVVSIFLLCSAVAVGTWAVEYQVLVLPRDFKIKDLEDKLAAKESSSPTSEIVLEPTYLHVGDSIKTKDGICLIHVDRILASQKASDSRSDLLVQLSVIGGEAQIQYDPVPTGKRLLLVTEDAKYEYFFDIIEIQTTQVSVSVTRQLVPKRTPK
jgi:hypothetical protein